MFAIYRSSIRLKGSIFRLHTDERALPQKTVARIRYWPDLNGLRVVSADGRGSRI